MTHKPIKVNGQSATIKLLLMSMASQPKALKDLEHQVNHPARFWRRMFFWGQVFKHARIQRILKAAQKMHPLIMIKISHKFKIQR